jgi:hypothetical protein
MSFAAQTLYTSPQELYNKFLKDRQFDATDVATLGLELLDQQETYELIGHTRDWSVQIPYYDVKGQLTGFNRVRVLQPRGKMKYSQARGSGSHIYFPPNVAWVAQNVLSDVDIPLIITEGEFKAYQIAKVDTTYAIIGLAGVTSWSDKSGLPLHRDLMQFAWQRKNSFQDRHRKVYIIFDYDGAEEDGEPNKQVGMAEAKLAITLRGLGADIHLCRVGKFAPVKGEKYAIDDHLLAGQALGTVLSTTASVLTGLTDYDNKLYELRTQYAILNGDIIRIKDAHIYRSWQSAKIDTAQHQITFTTTNAQGIPKSRDVHALEEYIKWQRACKLEQINMYPEFQGMPITPRGEYNVFKDWAHEPVNGDPKPYLDIIEHFFKDEPSLIEYWHNWVGHVIQRPWIRHNTCPQFCSILQGVGKSAIPEFIALAMGVERGQPAAIMGPGELFESKNGELEGKVFVVVNEPNSDQNTHQAKFKDLITTPRLMIDRKYGAKFTINNYVNYVLTTNKPFVVQMDNGSRREMIYTPTSLDPLDMGQRVKSLMEWGEKHNGFGIVLSWYLDRDLGDFDPKAPAPMTLHKQTATELSRSPLQAFAADLSNWVIQQLKGRAFFDPTHLTLLCQKWGHGDKERVVYIRRAMAGFGAIDPTKPVKVHGKTERRTLFIPYEEGYKNNAGYSSKGPETELVSLGELAKLTDEAVSKELQQFSTESF